MPDIWVPTGVGHSDFTERKSRFHGDARKVISAADARRIVSESREEHPKSRHVVWAYVIGSDGALKGLSDDGEPHGTAGRPVLDPIIGDGLTNTMVTVVRYFGGIKLGTGGLVSAYGRCCREALDRMSREKLIPRTRLNLKLDYSFYEPVCRLTKEAGGRVDSEDFAAGVTMELDVPTAALEEYSQAVADTSRGSAVIVIR